ncbi:hypothetical protein B0H13DRAFT_2386530 [Mycena leptocephala]|nr:hypothetical protein B0H13DRAFT_2386530 [Mycena leptocephala]
MAGVGLLFGPMLAGVLLNMILYGAVVTQVDCGVRPIPYYPDSISSTKMYAYYQRFADDPAWIRYFMLYLFIVGFGNVVVECGIIFEPLIIRYGTVAAYCMEIDYYINRLNTDPTFAAWRISVSLVIHLPGLITLISLSSLLAESISATVWLASSAVCDVVIAVGMTHALYKRKTGSFVNGQINRIIRLSLETGTLTAITALMDIFLFLGFPRTTMNFIVNFPLSSLYTCSILAMLFGIHHVIPASDHN